MRPRIQRLKISRPPGQRFESVEQGCSWCRSGEDPKPGTEICQGCVLRFKRILTSYRWRMARKQFMSNAINVLCICGCQRFTELIDHIKPWRFFPSLFWEPTNWQPMYGDCNKRKAMVDNQKYRQVD